MIFASQIPPFEDFFYKKADLDLSLSKPNMDEVKQGIDGNIVEIALGLAQELVDFQNIKYIGLTGDAGILGVASTQYNNQLLQDLFNKIIRAKQNWDELSPNEQGNISQIEMNAERLRQNQELVAFQVNPANIIAQADQYMAGIKKELEASDKTFEDLELNEAGVRGDLITLILASVFAHERKHGFGGSEMHGEGGAEMVEKELLQKDIKDLSVHPEFNYLNDFQIIQQNI